jgi:thiamine-monophosphate kinase
LGEVPSGAALRRNAARAGDDLWVSHSHEGGIGDARLALEVFRGQVQLHGESFSQVRRAMEWPAPRVALGVALRGVAHAAIDLSDGLAGDLGHLLAQSHVGALLEWAALPRSSAVSALPLPLQQQCVLGGGDDYELLFSAPASARDAVRRAAALAEVAVSRIGEIRGEDGLRVRWPDGSVSPWTTRGFDHFAGDAR